MTTGGRQLQSCERCLSVTDLHQQPQCSVTCVKGQRSPFNVSTLALTERNVLFKQEERSGHFSHTTSSFLRQPHLLLCISEPVFSLWTLVVSVLVLTLMESTRSSTRKRCLSSRIILLSLPRAMSLYLWTASSDNATSLSRYCLREPARKTGHITI